MSKMKILVATLVALGLATPALAFDVKWSGDLNNRFSYSTDAALSGLSGDTTDYVNVGDNIAFTATDKRKNESDFFGELKYRLKLTASDDDKKVSGVVGFEFGARKYGASGADFGGDDNVFELQYAYTDFEVPFDTASRLRLGLQPVGLNKFVWSDNAGGVKWMSKRDKLEYSLGWFRNDNSGTPGTGKNTYDDVYAIDATYKYAEGGSVNAFVIAREDGNYGGFSSQNKEQWYGLAVNGQADNIFFGATGIYLGGEVTNLGGTALDYDRKGYLLNAEVTGKFDKARVKAGWLYASGDDDATDNDLENFDSIDIYMGGFGSVVIFDSFADDNTLVSSPYIRDKGLNMPYVALDYDLNDKTSVGISYLFINAAEDIDGSADADVKGETDLGHEVAVRASYKVAKGMTAGIEAGYLIGGDAWDELSSTGDDGDNVFRTDASFRFKF